MPRRPVLGGSRRVAKDWIATIPMLLLVPALLSPFLGAGAAEPPVLSVTGVSVPGATLSVAGANFEPRQWIQLQWDTTSSGMPSVRVSNRSTFSTTVSVPATAAPGQHVLSAVEAGPRNSRSLTAGVAGISPDPIATVTVTVADPSATPAPTPSDASPGSGSPDVTPTTGTASPSSVAPTTTPTASTPPTGTTSPTPTTAPTTAPTAAPTLAPTPAPVPAPPATGAIYGPGIHMDGIGNTELGGTTNDGNRHYAAIFKADSSRISAFRQFLANPLTNYSGGDGGTIEYRLRLATSSGPTNTTVGSPVTVRYGMSRPDGPAPRIVAPADWVTSPGQWYALVARNIDPNPTVNFTSVDGIVFSTVPAGQSTQPRFADGQWQSFYSSTGSGSWKPRYGNAMTAQLQLEYADGRIDGVGYVYRRSVISLGSTAEVFTPRTTVAFSQIAFRAIGSGTLTLRLESGGATIAQGSTTSVDGGWDIVSVSGILQAGQSYRLVASGGGLTTKSIQKGSAYGFAPATYFADGSVQGDAAADLQFYFR